MSFFKIARAYVTMDKKILQGNLIPELLLTSRASLWRFREEGKVWACRK